MGISAGVAVSVVGSYMSSEAAKSAAGTQAEAGRAAMSTQERMLAEQQAIQKPYVTAGQTALDQLVSGLAPGGQFATPFTMAESPAQQFATKEALAAMRDQMQVGGQNLSTNAIVGAGKLAGNIGAQYENQAFNQWLQSRQAQMQPLQNIAGLGQASASGSAANIGTAGTNVSNLQTGIGNVQAAGTVGGTAPYASTMSDIGSLLMAQGLKPATNPTAPAGQLQTPSTAPAGYDWGTMAQPYQMAAAK